MQQTVADSIGSLVTHAHGKTMTKLDYTNELASHATPGTDAHWFLDAYCRDNASDVEPSEVWACAIATLRMVADGDALFALVTTNEV